MEKKIFCIVVLMLLIATAALPVVNSLKATTISNHGEVLDQHSDWSDDCKYISDFEWQEFIPTMVTHTRIEVKIVQMYDGSPDLKLTIEKPLGTVLTSKEIPASAIPSGVCGWVSFDIPDVNLVPGNNYYIKLTTSLGSEYGWGFSANGLYPNGTSSIWPEDWCFRTFCFDNNPPTKPIGPIGPNSGKKGQQLTYTCYSTDLDGDKIRYGLDFVNNDFIVDDWTDDYYDSGYIVTTYLKFNIEGTYNFRVIAEDEYGAQSLWSDSIRISISKSKEKILNLPLLRLIDNAYAEQSKSSISIEIDEPEVGWIYIGGNSVIRFPSLPFALILGTITFKVSIVSDMNIECVDWYVDGIFEEQCLSEPYSWDWPMVSTFPGRHEVRVELLDVQGNHAEDSIKIIKLW